jgi:hypothetical protein
MAGLLKGSLIALSTFFILLSMIFFIAGLTPPAEGLTIISAVVLLVIGIIPLLILFFIIRSENKREIRVDQKIEIRGKDLIGGEKNTTDLKCHGCYAPLSSENVKFTDIGVIINCPYCGKVYTLGEKPKW